jgi:hypothetical protein
MMGMAHHRIHAESALTSTLPTITARLCVSNSCTKLQQCALQPAGGYS